jgi:hypothetical protein
MSLACPLPQAPSQDSFLRVNSVLSFIKNTTLRAIHHSIGDFFAAMGRQAV